MYTAIDLSKYIVSKCIRERQPVSNLQLQKILYYIQKDYLSRGDIAFSDDIEAWPCGAKCVLLFLRIWCDAYFDSL